MQWLAITLLTTTSAAELLSQELINCGSYGSAIYDKHDIDAMQRPDGYWDMIDEHAYDNYQDEVKVVGYFRMDASLGDNLNALQARLEELRKIDLGGIDLGSLGLSIDELSEQDWANSWKKYYKPTRVGKRLVIRPTWEEYTPQEGDLVLAMDPGTAFGTGTHETTSMCLELAEEYVQPGDLVYDVGCGTAILSIASILLGAKHALALDIDQMAVDWAVKNVELNHMEKDVTVRQGDLLSGTEGVCDFMFANIVADIIIMLSKDIPARLKKGGCFVCSGIIAPRENDVVEALSAIGLTHVKTLRKNDWVAMCWRV